MRIELALVIIWTFVGAITLCMKEVDKFSYAMCWVTLMAWLIKNFVEVIA